MISFKSFMIIFVTGLLFLLWWMPAYLIIRTNRIELSSLWLPIIAMSFAWGYVIFKFYFETKINEQEKESKPTEKQKD